MLMSPWASLAACGNQLKQLNPGRWLARCTKDTRLRSSSLKEDSTRALSIDDVVGYMDELGVEHISRAPSATTTPTPIKCILFLLKTGDPLLVIINDSARITESELSRYLDVPKSHVTLAPQDRLIDICGYAAGHVPPFGHRKSLRTIVDLDVASQEYICFGSEDEYVISAAELVRASHAEVAGISIARTSAIVHLKASETTTTTTTTQAGYITEAAQLRPFPWTVGSRTVQLNGIISQKRSIAKLLTFINLSPLGAESAAYLGRPWCHPETKIPADVQLILGKTLERRLGRERAIELFKSLRVGQIVAVTGRPQSHVPTTLGIHGSGDERREDTLDVVVDDIQIIDDGPLMYTKSQPGDQAGLPASAPVRGSSSGKKQKTRAPARPLDSAEVPLIYSHRIPKENIFVVDDIENLRKMEAIVFSSDSLPEVMPPHDPQIPAMMAPPPPPEVDSDSDWSQNARDATPVVPLKRYKRGFKKLGKTPTGWRPSLVVGLDAEWLPSSRDEPKTPVSILQIASHRHVFLIDLLSLCSAGAPKQLGEGLPEEQKVLSDVLTALFGHATIAKVGFGLRYDLERIVESYPWLPCCSAAGVPIRCHVDVRVLARTAGDGHTSFKNKGLSALCFHVLGCELNKEQQQSNWGARPLSQEQIEYAAADACCLVDLFNTLTGNKPELLAPYWMDQFASNLTDISLLKTVERQRSTYQHDEGGIAPYGREFHNGNSYTPGANLTSVGRVTAWRGGARATREIECNIDAIMQHLGENIPGDGGRVAVVNLAVGNTLGINNSSSASSDGVPLRTRIHFPRGSGVLELANAFLLFVNVPSLLYMNTFTIHGEGDEGVVCEMSWWSAKRQTMENPVMQRLLNLNSELRPEGKASTVLLFCRPLKEAYVCCGRLLPVATSECEDGRLSVSWQLVDYPALCTSKRFLRLLELQEPLTSQ